LQAWRGIMKQKRTGERRRRDNLRRNSRRRVANGIYACAICGKVRFRRDLEAHHENYEGITGKFRMVCKDEHRKITEKGRKK